MRFDIVSIFPESTDGILSIGVLGQARAAGLIDIRFHDLRDYTDDPHRVVDDRPYGGGAGMVMKVEPFVCAIEAIQKDVGGTSRVVLLSSQGRLFGHGDAARWATASGMILLCGRYEGIDERILDYVDEEIAIGDYVLAGGETAAVVIVEAVSRLTPGVVGKYESVATDSFFDGDRLGSPQYTRPPEFRGVAVPEVLMTGDHQRIDDFRKQAAWRKTIKNRPDLVGLDVARDGREPAEEAETNG